MAAITHGVWLRSKKSNVMLLLPKNGFANMKEASMPSKKINDQQKGSLENLKDPLYLRRARFRNMSSDWTVFSEIAGNNKVPIRQVCHVSSMQSNKTGDFVSFLLGR